MFAKAIVCFVSNNSFLEGIAFDSFRKHLVANFTHIYHLDLGGNARRLGGGNVFGIMVGVGITILIRNRASIKPEHQNTTIFYSKPDNQQSSVAKLTFLAEKKSTLGIEWQQLQPDENYNWLTEGLRSEFDTFLPLCSKEVKFSQIESLP